MERQTGDLGGHRRRIDGHHIVFDLRIESQHGHHDLHLIAQSLNEGGTQRAVDQPASQDGILAGAALAAEEGSGNAAGRIHLLLDVDGQREEIDRFAWCFLGSGGAQQHGVAVQIDCGRAIGLLGQYPGLEPDHMLAIGSVVDDGLGEFEVFTLHLSFLSARGRGVRPS